MYALEYLAISSCILFITWANANSLPSCDVYVDGNETHVYSDTIKFHRYYQMVADLGKTVNLTFVVPSHQEDDGISYYNWTHSGKDRQRKTCDTAPQCELNITYTPAPKAQIVNFQDSNNEIWIKPLVILHSGRNICLLDLQISEERVDIKFELKWIDVNSLNLEVTAGFPMPTEFTLTCEGRQVNVSLLNGIFHVKNEELRYNSCQVLASNYLHYEARVDVPPYPFTTTPPTRNLHSTEPRDSNKLSTEPRDSNKLSTEPRDSNKSAVTAVSAVLGCLVIILSVVSILCWRRRKHKPPNEQPQPPPSGQHQNIECEHQRPPHMPSLPEHPHNASVSFPTSSNSADASRARTAEPVSLSVQEHHGAIHHLSETLPPLTEEEQFDGESVASEEEGTEVKPLNEHAT